jgi:NAD(P)-dependent dehydrogenase (short-subunit alcohol dehydrogenase family)
MFKAAAQGSPGKSCDIVIANAGISGPDPVFSVNGTFDHERWNLSKLRLRTYHHFGTDTEEPQEPNVNILMTNCIGATYTTNLAMHWLSRQPKTGPGEKCVILTGSVASYLDQPGSPQYNVAKWGVRGLMRCLRRTSHQSGIRINMIAPWYVKFSMTA